jgi:hypothetical protein
VVTCRGSRTRCEPATRICPRRFDSLFALVAAALDKDLLRRSSATATLAGLTGTRRRIGAPLTGHTGSVTSVAFSPDGRTLAATDTAKTPWLWDGPEFRKACPRPNAIRFDRSLLCARPSGGEPRFDRRPARGESLIK